MNVASLGFRTDLTLLERAGSTVVDRGDHLVVRTPDNPGFYWGNFLLLDHVPGAGHVEEWLDRFAAAFPEARHRAFGFDSQGTVDELSGFEARGFGVESSTVMTASSVHPPARPNGEATYRALESDEDWRQSIELRIACDNLDQPVSHREFVTRRANSNRALVAAGHGRWFGAFLGDTLVAQMGLVAAAPGLARFQSVETHPEHRGRGLASTLAHRVSAYGFEELHVKTLVIVADPDYLAIRIYRAIGFTDSEVQLQAELAPEPVPGESGSVPPTVEGSGRLVLREVEDRDLGVLFEHWTDPDAIRMAAFTSPEQHDRAAFERRWARLRSDVSTTNRIVEIDGRVVGQIASFDLEGRREVTYWIGREDWGRGIATRALRQFLELEATRPLYAGAASDNAGSIRVLTKCGFRIVGEGRGFAHGRNEETDEVILRLDT